MAEHADHFFQARQQVAGRLEVDKGRDVLRVEADHTVWRGVEDVAKLELDVSLIALLLAQQQPKVRTAGADLTAAAIAGVGVSDFFVERGVARQNVLLLRAAALDVVTGDKR